MGLTKEMWLEEESRQYHQSSDAVCVDCFSDQGFKAFIADNLEAHSCSICGRTSKQVIAAPADTVLEFFLDKISIYYEDANQAAPWSSEEGGYTIPTYDMHELVYQMHPVAVSDNTLDWLYSKLKDDISYCDRDWQILSPGKALEVSWEHFAQSVKHTTRFLFFPKPQTKIEGEPFLVGPGSMLEALGEVLQDCKLIKVLPLATKIYRARGHDIGTIHDTPKELGPPPLKFAKYAGRMNAPGIVVFYGAIDKKTAVTEATGSHTTFSVGEFETLVDLPIVDLTSLPRVPSIFETGDRESLSFLKNFAEEVSRPFEPDAEIHIEYVPTQVVSEYLRHRFKTKDGKAIRGLLYQSAKVPGTTNLALFIESAEVEGVETEWWQTKDPVLRLTSVEELMHGALDPKGAKGKSR